MYAWNQKVGWNIPRKCWPALSVPLTPEALVAAHHFRVYHGYSRVYTEQIVEMDSEIFLLKPYQQ